MRLHRIACAVLVILGVTGAPVRARAVDPPPRSITVIGVGRELGAPDVARIGFAVEHTAPTAQAASQAAAKSATDLMDALRKQVGDQGKVQTGGYQLQPVYRQETERLPPDRPHRPEIIGYSVTNEIDVETYRVDTVGALIDAATTAGAARIGDVSFSLRDPAPARNRALKSAGADAAGQATAIAEALQVKIVRVLEATTEGGSVPVFYKRTTMAMAAEAAATPVEPGDVTTEVRLRVTYGIE